MEKVNGQPVLQINTDCPLCNHAQRVAAASMRELGATVDEIAVAVQLDVSDVERHFLKCVPSLPSGEGLDVPLSVSDQQLQLLLQNSSELYHSAVLQGNMVAASSALAVRLRALAEMGRRSEIRSEKKSLLDGSDPLRPETWNSDLRKFLIALYDAILHEHRALPTSSQPQSQTKGSRRKKEVAHA